jgi:hypothetical protein
MNKDCYDIKKIEFFTQRALKDYKNTNQIGDLCKTISVNKTDGSFIQIGIRPLINEDIFLEGANVHPELPSIGMMVSHGERDFLIKNILENAKIKRLKINRENIEEFTKHVYEYNKATILISLDFFIELTKKFGKRIVYENNKEILDTNYEVIFIPGGMMKNKIILIEKDSILWEKQIFKNEITNTEEVLNINIKPAEQFGKVDILVRSVNKIKHIDEDSIKIIEIEENETKTN